MLWTALTLGLFGSLHCIGMCGPIALALPSEHQSKWQSLSKVLLYNLGRVTTYTMLGILVGLVTEGAIMANIQSYISIGLGVGLLIIAFFSINVETKILQSPIFGQWFLTLKLKLGQLLKSNTYPTFYKIGLLNGFLPCGLVYMAVIGSIAMDNFINSTVYMILFGIGTIPLMLLTAISGQFIGFKFRKKMHKFYPVFFVFFALLLIMRGLNFEMPPAMEFWDSLKHEVMCF